MLNAIAYVVQFTGLGNDLDVADTSTDRDTQSVSVDYTAKRDAGPLATLSLAQKVVIACEDDSPQGGCAIHQCRIRYRVMAILEGGDDIDAL